MDASAYEGNRAYSVFRRRGAELGTVLVAGLLIGGLAGTAMAPEPPPPDLSVVWAQIEALSGEVAAERARADGANLAVQLSNTLAGWTAVRIAHEEATEALDAGDRVGALWWARDLEAAAARTPWPPLLQRAAARVAENATRMAEALFMEDMTEVEAARGPTTAAVQAIDLEVREVYLAYFGENPVGPRITLIAHIMGFRLDQASLASVNPTLFARVGQALLVELRNDDVVHHNLVVEGLEVRSEMVEANETIAVVVDARRAGSFEYFCDVPGHEETMSGTLQVDP